jgi:tRNA-splicing ligase RtcB
MTISKVGNGLLSWGSDVEPNTIDQAMKTARMPFIAGHVALMPDAHVGFGSTVGSVIPTAGAIMPAAVGVDIGCGMIAAETTLCADELPDTLEPLLSVIGDRIPAGVGKGRERELTTWDAAAYDRLGRPHTDLSSKQAMKAAIQFGTLGSGNHFVEVCLDERDMVWVVLHSGSRGIGNELAQKHIEQAKGLMRERFIKLEDPDLAYLVEGETSFQAYIADMLWAQEYALQSRAAMMGQALRSLFELVGFGGAERTINCHHNFTEREHHMGKNVWVTRKGAIRARDTDWGVIPGSMGTRSYIVKGTGSAASFHSCSHGAGRRMSRGVARRELTPESLTEAMAGKVWNADAAKTLVDEHPLAYKDIDQVMADQADLATIQHTLRQVLNYKGF